MTQQSQIPTDSPGAIIAIHSTERKIGRSTITRSSAQALAMLGHKVLIVDLDNQCNTTACCAYKRQNVAPSLYNLLTEDVELEDVIKPSKYNRIDILPNEEITATLEPKIIFKEMDNPADEHFQLIRKKIHTYIKKKYDFILIDTPPNFGIFSLFALNCADLVIIPVDTESCFQPTDLRNSIKIIKKFRQTTTPNQPLITLLFNKVDRRKTITRHIITRIKETFSEELALDCIVPVSSFFEKTQKQRKTIIDYNKSCDASKAYLDIASKLADLKKNRFIH